MFCTECGNEYAGNPNFCVSCGAKLSRTGPESPQKIVEVEVKCPYCGHRLKNKPMRKTKCPSCERYIYVKAAPTSETKVLVTEQGANEIEKQWERHYQEKERERLESDPEYRQMRIQLEVKRGTRPSVNDVRWALANKQLLQHARRGDWGFYRCVKFDMAQILQGENKLRQALQAYLEVCILDMNGPNNLGGERDPELLKEYPPFDPSMGMIIPGITYYVHESNLTLGLEPDALKAVFMEAAKALRGLRLPVDTDKAWEMLAEALLTETDETNGYALLAVAEARMKKLESSGAGPEQYGEVLSMLEVALAKNIYPFTQAIVHRHIGEIQHRLGRDADAMQHLEAAIGLNPKVGVKRLLESLRKSQKPPIPSAPDGHRA